MRKILVVLSVFVFLSVARFSSADEAARRKLAEKLLVVMKSEEQYKLTMSNAKKSQQEMMKTMPGAEQNSEMVARQVDDMMANDFSYEAMRSDMITVYAEIFTEEELQGLINFYSSELGQAFVKKSPQMTERMMQLNQKRMQKVMQESQQKMQARMQEQMKQREAQDKKDMQEEPQRKADKDAKLP